MKPNQLKSDDFEIGKIYKLQVCDGYRYFYVTKKIKDPLCTSEEFKSNFPSYDKFSTICFKVIENEIDVNYTYQVIVYPYILHKNIYEQLDDSEQHLYNGFRFRTL